VSLAAAFDLLPPFHPLGGTRYLLLFLEIGGPRKRQDGIAATTLRPLFGRSPCLPNRLMLASGRHVEAMGNLGPSAALRPPVHPTEPRFGTIAQDFLTRALAGIVML
jgi:hypothetical protein